MRKSILLAVAAAVAAVVLPAGSAAATSDRMLHAADHHRAVWRVTYVHPEKRRALFVILNTGASFRLMPCRTEDGHGCYWDADARGNGHGHSFVSVRGRIVYSHKVGAAR